MSDKTNTYHESDILFNNDMSAHVSSIYSDYFKILDSGEMELYSAYTRFIDKASDYVDISSFCPTVIMPSGTLSAVFPNRNNAVEWDYFSSEPFAEALDVFERNANYLWGNYTSGGVFIYRRTANNYDMYIQNGVFQLDDTHYFTDTGFLGSYTIAQLQKVVFTWNAWDMFNQTSWSEAVYLSMLYDTDPANPSTTIAGAVTGGYQIAGTGPVAAISAIDPTWIGILETDMRPPIIFSGFAKRDFYGPSDLDSFTKISGSVRPNTIDWEDNPYGDDGFAGDGGGGGTIDHQSDEDGTSDSGGIGSLVAQSGLVKVYNPTVSELSAFNTFLFAGISDSLITVLKKLTSEPMQYIISLMMYHFNPTTSASQHIMFGGIDSGVGAAVVSSTTKKIDCGTLTVPAQFKSFLDYNPNSDVQLFLPYIGFVNLNQDQICGSAITIVYNVDLLSGACICEVHISRAARSSSDDTVRRILYTYSGNCSMQLPLSSIDQRGLVDSILNIGTSAVSGAVSGGGAGAAAGAISGALQSITTEKQSVHHGSGISSNMGYMGKQKPYLVLGRPITCIPVNFGAFEGWTSGKRATVSQLSGYTEIDPDTIWTDNFGHATDEEAQMIKDIMNGGVYL